jgi:hypothetical protein
MLATGVVALSGGLTSTSVAFEPDFQQEGAAPPQAGAPPADREVGRFDGSDELGPGAPDETLLSDVLDDDGVDASPDQTQPGSMSEGGEGPPEADPLTAPDRDPNESGPIAHAGPPSAVPPTPAPRPGVPLPAPDADAQLAPRLRMTKVHLVTGVLRFRRSSAKSGAPRGLPAEAETTSAGSTTYSAAPTSSPVDETVAAVPPSAPSRRNARTYTVQAGDSLWSIAAGRLGPGAADAAITSEVGRLWRLNRVRIGTGDPGLLRVGTTLRLR